MKLYKEESISGFKFWGGAADRASKLTGEEFNQIEAILEELYPDGMSETQLNDLFWFDFESIAEWLRTTEDEISERE